MPTEEFEKLKEALKKPPTEEARVEAAQCFREYERAKKASGRQRSRPTLVSLGYKKSYPTAIEVKDIPSELEQNPAFFEHMRDIISAEED